MYSTQEGIEHLKYKSHISFAEIYISLYVYTIGNLAGESNMCFTETQYV